MFLENRRLRHLRAKKKKKKNPADQEIPDP